MINAYTVTVQLCRVTNAVTEDMLVSFYVNVKGRYFGVNTSIIRYTFFEKKQKKQIAVSLTVSFMVVVITM